VPSRQQWNIQVSKEHSGQAARIAKEITTVSIPSGYSAPRCGMPPSSKKKKERRKEKKKKKRKLIEVSAVLRSRET